MSLVDGAATAVIVVLTGLTALIYVYEELR